MRGGGSGTAASPGNQLVLVRMCVGRGCPCACERGGRPVCFGGLAALGCWGISLSCWLGLSGPVWEVEAIRILRHEHILSSRPAGTLGPRWAGKGGAVGGTGPVLKGLIRDLVWASAGEGGEYWLGVPRKTLRQCPLHFQRAQA